MRDVRFDEIHEMEAAARISRNGGSRKKRLVGKAQKKPLTDHVRAIQQRVKALRREIRDVQSGRRRPNPDGLVAREIMEALSKGYATFWELAKLFNVSKATIERFTDAMARRGRIVMVPIKGKHNYTVPRIA